MAAICSTELLGPVVFDGFDASGRPVGKPFRTPLIQLAAVSEAQTNNTMSLIVEMLGQGLACDEYFIDIGKTRILSDHGRLEPVTANAKSREGQRPTFAVLDEVHLWLSGNHGDQLAATIRRNLGKVSGRSIETTNAFAPGEGSVAEKSFAYWDDIRSGRKTDREGFLFDHVHAPDDTPYDGPGRRAGLVVAYGSAARESGGWVDLDRIEQEMDDPATSEADGRRFYFNQVVRGYSQWMDPIRWRANGLAAHVSTSEPIALGFDGSIRQDSTALVACRVSDGFLWPVRVWERPSDAPKDWEVPFLEVDRVVRETLDGFPVVWLNADPAYWQDIVGRWAVDYENVYEFWTHRRALMCKATERFHTAALNGTLPFSSAPEHEVLSRHVLNCHALETSSGVLVRKEFPQSDRKIDACMAAILALEARAMFLASESEDADNEILSF